MSEISFSEKVTGSMTVAKDWLEMLSKAKLTDEERAVKSIEVCIKMCAQLMVFMLQEKYPTYNRVTKAINLIHIKDTTVSHDSIRNYALAAARVGPEKLAKIYRKLSKLGIIKSVENNTKTLRLQSAEDFTARLKKSLVKQ
jgi:hypothetical protein